MSKHPRADDGKFGQGGQKVVANLPQPIDGGGTMSPERVIEGSLTPGVGDTARKYRKVYNRIAGKFAPKAYQAIAERIDLPGGGHADVLIEDSAKVNLPGQKGPVNLPDLNEKYARICAYSSPAVSGREVRLGADRRQQDHRLRLGCPFRVPYVSVRLARGPRNRLVFAALSRLDGILVFLPLANQLGHPLDHFLVDLGGRHPGHAERAVLLFLRLHGVMARQLAPLLDAPLDDLQPGLVTRRQPRP